MPKLGPGRISSLLAELKRRKVYHVTVAYIVLAVAGLEVIDLLIPRRDFRNGPRPSSWGWPW